MTFLQRMTVAQAVGEAINAHAFLERDRKRDRAVAKLQAKFRTLCAAHAPPRKLAEVTAAIDKLGRVTNVPIKPPDTVLPVIDRAVARLFGISPRMVRKCRTDPRLRPFMPHPVWVERDWVRAARLEFEARKLAKRLMTPERYAKQEPVAVTQHGVKILSPPLTDFGAPVVPRGWTNFHRGGEPSGGERVFDRLWDQRRKGWPIGLRLPRPRLTEEERDTIAAQRRAIFGQRTAESG